ncbi:MAG: hypothetical protein L0Y48_01125 [Fusobacteria bacterium]|nr:hypothetical protein [Fusobacteriota bacterium]
MSRRKLRIIAMEIVYQKELETFSDDYFKDLNLNIEEDIFLNELISIGETKEKLIDDINTSLKDWTYDRLGVLEGSILLLSFRELLEFKDIPIKVTIDEWVEITKEYCGEEAKKLINGVLNNFKNKLLGEKVREE